MYVPWIAGSQLMADWYKPQNLQITIEIVMKLEQQVILLEVAGTAGKKVSGFYYTHFAKNPTRTTKETVSCSPTFRYKGQQKYMPCGARGTHAYI